MLDNTFKVVFLIGLIAGAAVRVAGLRVAGYSREQRKRPTGLEGLLLFLVSIGMWVLPLLYLFSSWLDFADYPLPAWVGWAGVPVFVAALWLLWRSHADLGRSFSFAVEIREEHALVSEGVFRHIRHPMYAAHLLWAVAQVLLLHNWIAGPAFVVASIPLYALRIPREERMMLEQHGEAYRAYMGRTGRFTPRLWK